MKGNSEQYFAKLIKHLFIYHKQLILLVVKFRLNSCRWSILFERMIAYYYTVTQKNRLTDRVYSTLFPPHRNAGQIQHLSKLHKMSHDLARTRIEASV